MTTVSSQSSPKITVCSTASVLFVVVLIAAWSAFAPARAQNYDYEELPVLTPNVDFNGVSPTAGTFATASPLHFSAPGAGRLDLNVIFNGRRNTFNLNFFVEDQTFTPVYGDPNERHVKVHLGGQDKLFTCWDDQPTGACEQDREQDGSILARTAPHTYVYTDRNGAVYKFDHYWHLVDQNICYEFEEKCNVAGYKLYAVLANISYANGEKLTFEPYSNYVPVTGGYIRRDTIRSNLGYELHFERDVPGQGSNTTPGLNWLVHRGNLLIDRATLYRGSELINTLTMTETNSGDSTIKTQTDDLGREYRVEFLSKDLRRCAPLVDMHSSGYSISHPMLPVLVRGPGGVTTTVSYYMTNNGQDFALGEGPWQNVPVKTVGRGGQTWQYDNVKDQKTLTGPLGYSRTASFAYLIDGYDYANVYSECMPAGYQETVYVDAKITSFVDELDRQTDYEYAFSPIYSNPFDVDSLTDVTLPEANGYHYDYDDRGNLMKITQIAKPGSGLPNRVVFEAGYPATCSSPVKCNKPEWVKDAKGLRTDYTYYSTHGGVDTVTRPAARAGRVRPKSTYTYTSMDTGDGIIWRQTGSSTCVDGENCVGTEDELKTVTTYWNNTFLPETKTAMAGDGAPSITDSFVYDDAGHVTEATDPMGQTTYYFYDVVGRKIGDISPDPDDTGPLPRLATRTTYNDDNQPTLVESGSTTGTALADLNAMTVDNWVETDYDNVGRKVKDTTKAGGMTYAVTQYSYDAWGRPLCTAIRMNLSSIPSNACVLGTAGAYGDDRIRKNEYDAAGQLDKIYRAFGTALQQVYANYEYSLNGKQISVIDANNNKSKFEYDGYDRQTHLYFPVKTKGGLAHSTTDYEQYGYDLNDNRISVRRRNGDTISYIFDDHNQVIVRIVPELAGVTSAHTEDVYLDYNLRGSKKFARFGSDIGQGITYDHDPLGRMTGSTINFDGITRSLVFGHDNNGVRTLLTHPDGQSFYYNHDNLNRLKSIQDGNLTVLTSYEFDDLGRMDAMTGGITTNYGFDGIGRLESILHDLAGITDDNTYGYQYNPASQLTDLMVSNYNHAPILADPSETYVANGLNQYTSVSGNSHSYDNNGNLTSDGQTIYIYDQENRLVKATTASGELKAELWYDPIGRLFKVQGPADTTYFFYDGDELIAEFNGTSTSPAHRYIHGQSVDDPVVWFEGSSVLSSVRRHFRANHQGSIVAAADASGSLLFLPRYDSWGNPESGYPLRFGFTGQAWIPELGLWHYKARFYSPQLGRFLQADPIGYGDNVNLYMYARNDPLNSIDPTGSFACGGLCIAGAIAIGSAIVSVVSDYVAAGVTGQEVSGKDVARNAVVSAATSPMKNLKAGGAAVIAGASELAGSIERGDSVGDTVTNTLSASAGAATGAWAGNTTVGQKAGDMLGDALGALGRDAGERIGNEGMASIGFAAGQAIGPDAIEAAAGTPIGNAVDVALDAPLYPNADGVPLPPKNVPTHQDFIRECAKAYADDRRGC